MRIINVNSTDIIRYEHQYNGYIDESDFEEQFDNSFFFPSKNLSFKSFINANNDIRIEIRGQKFSDLSFDGTYKDLHFINCTFSNVDFTSAAIVNSFFTGNIFSNVTFSDEKVINCTFYLNNFCNNNNITTTKFYIFNSSKAFRLDYLKNSIGNVIAKESESIEDFENPVLVNINNSGLVAYIDKLSKLLIDSLPSPLKSISPTIEFLATKSNDQAIYLNDLVQDYAPKFSSTVSYSSAICTFSGCNIVANSAIKVSSYILPPAIFLNAMIPAPAMTALSIIYLGGIAYTTYVSSVKSSNTVKFLASELDKFVRGEVLIEELDTSPLIRFTKLSEDDKQTILDNIHNNSPYEEEEYYDQSEESFYQIISYFNKNDNPSQYEANPNTGEPITDFISGSIEQNYTINEDYYL